MKTEESVHCGEQQTDLHSEDHISDHSAGKSLGVVSNHWNPLLLWTPWLFPRFPDQRCALRVGKCFSCTIPTSARPESDKGRECVPPLLLI